MKDSDTVEPGLTDVSLNMNCALAILVVALAISKVMDVSAVTAPEIVEPAGAVQTGQGLREKRLTLSKDGKIFSEGNAVEWAELGRFVAGASGVVVEADKEAAVGRLVEMQQAVLKQGCEMQILVKEKKI